MRSSACPEECTWSEELGGEVEGVCVPSGMQAFLCEILSKPLCDRYISESSYISGFTITGAPCLFIGPGDSVDTLCVSQSWLALQNCTVIKSNEVLAYDEDERKSCVDAHLILEWPFTCTWVEPSDGSDYGSCYTVYYMNGSGLFLIFIFICYYRWFLFDANGFNFKVCMQSFFILGTKWGHKDHCSKQFLRHS
jgi:hypothetical protein